MSTRRATVMLAAGLFAVGLTLRPQVVAIGPLATSIESDLHVSHAVTGLLGTIPILCMGLFAPPAQMLLARFGARAGLAVCLAVIGGIGVARAFAPIAAAVVALTIPVGVGMAVAQSMLPAFVKSRFADRPVLATGLYATGMGVGGASASIVAVPLAHALGSWRDPLLVISLVALAALAVWWLLTRRAEPHVRRSAAIPRPPWRSQTAWLLVAFFALLSMLYYGMNSWLADSFVERGWMEGHAGTLVGVMNLSAIPASFLVSSLADRFGSRRTWLVGLALCCLLGTVGIVALPGAAWLWVVLFGAAGGGAFPLLMTLPLDVARGPADVGSVVAMMLGLGYTLSAVAPFALGGIRDVTGGFDAALWTLVGLAVVNLLVCSTLSSERLRRGVRGAGAGAEAT